MTRLRQWWKRKRAEDYLRRNGICPTHFVPMKLTYYGYDHDSGPGYAYECAVCDEKREEEIAETTTAGVRRAIDVLKRGTHC